MDILAWISMCISVRFIERNIWKVGIKMKELKDTIELMNSEDYKERFRA